MTGSVDMPRSPAGPALPEGIAAIIEDMRFLDDWEERYRYLIDLGRRMPGLKPAEYAEENKVRGCASQVWLVIDREEAPERRLVFRGDSDALIVKGLVALVIALFSGRTPQEILATDSQQVFGAFSLKEHLTPQRSNGLNSMIERIRAEARAALA